MRQLLTPPDTKNEKNAVGDKDWKRIPLNNAMPQNLRGLNSCYKTITINKMKTKVKATDASLEWPITRHSLISFGNVLCPLSGIVPLSSKPHSQGDKCFAFLTRSLSESLGRNQQSLCYFLSRKTEFSVAVHDLHCQCDALLHSTFRISLNYAPLSGHHHCGRSSRADSIVHQEWYK